MIASVFMARIRPRCGSKLPRLQVLQCASKQGRACGTAAETLIQRAEELSGVSTTRPIELDGVLPAEIIKLHSADVDLAKRVLTRHDIVSDSMVEGLAPSNSNLEDVLDRVHMYRRAVAGKDGPSGGHRLFRDAVAKFLAERDGIETLPKCIFMTSGSWQTARSSLQALLQVCEQAVVFVPSPGPPAYRETAALMGRCGVSYHVDDDDWEKTIVKLEETVGDVCRNQKKSNALVVANPTLTGRLIPSQAVESLLRLAERQSLVVIVEEDNFAMRGSSDTISFRLKARQMNLVVPILSYFSLQAYTGQHGGYMYFENASNEFLEKMQRTAETPSIKCQAWVASLLSPWIGENYCLDTLIKMAKANSKLLGKLNEVEGIRCKLTDAGAYSFPQVSIRGFIMKKAISLATPADQVYCLEMLNRTGVLTIPGSCFGQRPGLFHFRMSLVQEEATFVEAVKLIVQFHSEHPAGWFR